jgi:hypothetical protein
MFHFTHVIMFLASINGVFYSSFYGRVEEISQLNFMLGTGQGKDGILFIRRIKGGTSWVTLDPFSFIPELT